MMTKKPKGRPRLSVRKRRMTLYVSARAEKILSMAGDGCYSAGVEIVTAAWAAKKDR